MREPDNAKVVDVRTTDPQTGEVLAEMRAIHVRTPRSAFGTGFLMTAQKQLAYLVTIRREISGECMWVMIHLLSELDFHNAVQVSPTDIARKVDMYRPNVVRAIKRLVEIGVLLEGGRVGMHRSYRLNPEFGWKGSSIDHHIALRARMKKANLKVVV
jgi:hypothetical protein